MGHYVKLRCVKCRVKFSTRISIPDESKGWVCSLCEEKALRDYRWEIVRERRRSGKLNREAGYKKYHLPDKFIKLRVQTLPKLEESD